MAHMPNIASEAWQAATHHHHDQAQPAPQKGTSMTLLADLKALTAHLASNPLVDQLVTEGLGLKLAPADIDAVIGIVRTIESAHNGQQPMPQRVPQATAPAPVAMDASAPMPA